MICITRVDGFPPCAMRLGGEEPSAQPGLLLGSGGRRRWLIAGGIGFLELAELLEVGQIHGPAAGALAPGLGGLGRGPIAGLGGVSGMEGGLIGPPLLGEHRLLHAGIFHALEEGLATAASFCSGLSVLAAEGPDFIEQGNALAAAAARGGESQGIGQGGGHDPQAGLDQRPAQVLPRGGSWL